MSRPIHSIIALAAALLFSLPSCRVENFGTDDLEKTTISFSSSSIVVAVGGTAANAATASSGATLTYISGDESIATVNKSNGTVTGVKTGSTTITATSAATDVYASASASYTVTVVASSDGTVTTVTFEYATLSLKPGDTSLNPATATSGAAVSYSCSNTAVATVGDDGLVTALSDGTAYITATAEAANGYTAASANCRVTVKGADDTGSSDIDPHNASDEVSTFIPDGTVNVVFSSGGVEVGGDTGLISYTTDGASVTVTNGDESAIKYVLSGSSSNGFFKLYSGRKQLIELSGLNLTNPSGAAINNQSGKRTYVVLTGKNSLSDGSRYTLTPEGEDEKAAFFSEGQLCFSGTGSLEVNATGKAAITSDDYLRFLGGTVIARSGSGHALRGKDAVIVSAGTITAECSADMKKAISTDGFYQQDGGTVTLNSSGSAAYDSEDGDYSGAACIKADGNFIMNDGVLTCTATGQGGKGISCDGTGYFNGGTITAKATGSDFTKGSVHPKAIKCDGPIVVTGGEVNVSSSRHEAMTTDGTWTQSGGMVIANAYDDAVNSASSMKISGGYLFGHGTNNDGIDANSSIEISGGIVIGVGANGAETGIDSVEGTYVTVNGGYVLSQGGSIGPFNTTNSKAYVTFSASAGTKFALQDGGDFIVAYTVQSGGTNIILFTPGLKSGSSYDAYTGVSYTPQYFGCFSTDGISGGSKATSLTASSSSTGGGMGGGPGGGPGGGRR